MGMEIPEPFTAFVHDYMTKLRSGTEVTTADAVAEPSLEVCDRDRRADEDPGRRRRRNRVRQNSSSARLNITIQTHLWKVQTHEQSDQSRQEYSDPEATLTVAYTPIRLSMPAASRWNCV